MNDKLIINLKKLAEEGDSLLQSGQEIPSNFVGNHNLPVIDWILRCNTFLSHSFGKDSEVLREFKEAYTLQMSVSLLVSLAMSVSPTSVHKENE